MSVDFDIRPMVQEHSAVSMDRLRVVRRFEDLRLAEIDRGVVFVFAAWSGPAVVAFRRFTQIMSEMPTESLDLAVLDIDSLNADSAVQPFGIDGFRAGGWGETIWVRGGVVFAREIPTPPAEQAIRDHIGALLA